MKIPLSLAWARRAACVRVCFRPLQKNVYFKQVKLPGDFEWDEAWRVDCTYAASDGHGWSYGGSFAALEQHLARGESSGAADSFDLARRRRWVRASRRVDKVRRGGHS